jgi:hypothetical protein
MATDHQGKRDGQQNDRDRAVANGSPWMKASDLLKQQSSEARLKPSSPVRRETGDSTGIFQVVLEMPSALQGTNLERGEQIDLEYTDWGPSGADYVGQDDEDVNATIYTSNFGATVELDQKVYTWTDKVYITIVAPDQHG